MGTEHGERAARLGLLSLLVGAAAACGTAYHPPTWPEGSMRLLQGTGATIGACTVGVAGVSSIDARQPWTAQLSLVHPQAGASGRTSVRVDVREGDLLPLCGQFHPVVGIEPDRSDGDGNPGQARGAVVLGPAPISLPDVPLSPDGLVIPLGGRAGFVDPGASSASAGLSAELQAIERGASGTPTARLETWPGTARSLAAPGDIYTVEVHTGDYLQVQDRRYRVLSIQPPDPARKLTGWVELSGLPVP